MAPALFKACSAAVLLSVAAGDSAEATPVRDGCHELLRDISAKGYTDVELAAYCRATLPPHVCRDATTALGSQPWAPERISVACQKWEDDARAAPGREAATGYENYQELKRRADECMEQKAAAGLCKDPTTGSAIPLDQCVQWKLQEYPKYSAKVQEAIQKIFGTAVAGQGVPQGVPPGMPQAVPQGVPQQAKFESVTPMPVRGTSFAVLAESAGFAVLVAGAAVAARRRVKNSEQKHALVQDEDDA